MSRYTPLRSLVGIIGFAALFGAISRSPAQAQPAQGGEPILVLAAASLSDVLPLVARAWAAEGGGPVRFSFDATSRLAPQATQGAPADVFFSADQEWMDWLRDRGGVDEGTIRDFLGNRLVVVVPAGRPAPAGPEDLAAVRRLALAGENVPAGRYARSALEGLGVWSAVERQVVRGGSVRGTLEWVVRGEVDAGIVYKTDALAQPGVTVAFDVPEDAHGAVRYPAAVLATAPHPTEAVAFLDFAESDRGKAVFAAAGFDVSDAPEALADQAEGLAPLPSASSAIRISLIVALLATLAGLVPAVGLGWLLARRDFRGKTLVSTLVFAPMVLPPVVTGFLLLSLFGSQAPLGRMLSAAGVTVPFTLVGAALAALVVGLPLYVLSVRGAFDAVDPHFEELSWTLGVPPRKTFFRISLPLALPGIAGGAVLAFARALGEFGATVVLAGNVEGSTRTLALAVYTLLESPAGQRATWILVGASVALSLLALFGFEALSRRQRRRLEVHRGE